MFPADRIDEAPERHLIRTGAVFTRFDQQDSGNISYGVDVGGTRYFVKTAGDPDDRRPLLTHGERVALLRNAVRLGRTYRHPALPVLRQVIESPHGPMLVYDWADGELVGVPPGLRDDPTSAYARFRALPAGRVIAALDTVVDLHDLLGRGGEVANDFYDGCLIYDFDRHRLTLIDLDGYRPGPYRNDMGRMFGAARLMAPEEFTLGALIDQRTSVFTLGRSALVLLGEGTADPAAFRGPQRLHAVATRACQPEPRRRYDTLPEFCAAWRAARATEADPPLPHFPSKN